jgi:hypothetical protein
MARLSGSRAGVEQIDSVSFSSVVSVSERQCTETHDRLRFPVQSCAVYARRRTDFKRTPISPTIGVQDHLSEILLRSIRPKRATLRSLSHLNGVDGETTRASANCRHPPFDRRIGRTDSCRVLADYRKRTGDFVVRVSSPTRSQVTASDYCLEVRSG